MERGLKNMIALKARICCNGDTDKFIKAAVEQLGVTLPEDKTTSCPACESKGTLIVSTANIEINTGVLVKNAPAWKCGKCGEPLCDVRLIAEIEKIMGDSAEEIAFQELLKDSWQPEEIPLPLAKGLLVKI